MAKVLAGRSQWSPLLLALAVAFASVAVLGAATSAERALLLPALIMTNVLVLFVSVLWRRDGVLPVFEVGTVCVLATTIYSVLPLLAFYLSGQRWTFLSDARLFAYKPDAFQMGHFATRHVVYLAALAVSYLAFRGKAVASGPIGSVNRSTMIVLVTLGITITVYIALLGAIYGVSYSTSYADARITGTLITRLPYLLQQITHNVVGIGLVVKLGLITLLVARWQTLRWRLVLLAWLVFEMVAATLRMSGRTEVVILLLATGLLYHRMVRPWSFTRAALAGIAGLGAILAYGAMRDMGFVLRTLNGAGISAWSIANEFQGIFGTAYDLQMRSAAGTLPHIPWQLHVSDALLLIPQQVLPFVKVDPSDWYLTISGLQGTGFGAMFGVISQSVTGFGHVELVLRGLALGWMFAKVHRWYVARADGLWITLLYLFVCIWSYYTFRASTFYFVYMLLYSFVPAYLVVRLAAGLLRVTAGPAALQPLPGSRTLPVMS